MANGASNGEFRTPLNFDPKERWITFITLVTYKHGYGPEKLKENLKSKLDTFKGKIIIHMVATTWGAADAVIVWQAKDMDEAKKFRDNPGVKTIGDFYSMAAAHSDIW